MLFLVISLWYWCLFVLCVFVDTFVAIDFSLVLGFFCFVCGVFVVFIFYFFIFIIIIIILFYLRGGCLGFFFFCSCNVRSFLVCFCCYYYIY